MDGRIHHAEVDQYSGETLHRDNSCWSSTNPISGFVPLASDEKCVVNVIEAMGVQVEHIPGGCTGLCQPIDVGVGKPLQNGLRNMWEDWMVEQVGETVRFIPPSRQAVPNWVVAGFDDLPLDIIKNSWRHQPYSYFDNKENNNNEESIHSTRNLVKATLFKSYRYLLSTR